MKKNYFLLLGLCSFFGMAQQTISFDESNYVLGSIEGQGNGAWTVTLDGDDPIEGQEIVAGIGVNDSQALKLSHLESFGEQFMPIIGANYEFPVEQTVEDFTISAKVKIDAVEEGEYSNYEYVVYTVQVEDGEAYFVPVGGFQFNYEGQFGVIVDEYYSIALFEDLFWEPNTWYDLKVEITSEKVKYYVNNTLVYEIDAYITEGGINGFNFLHDNYGGNVIVDDITIISEDVDSMNASSYEFDAVNVYPNPSSDVINVINTDAFEVDQIEIFNVTGQKVISASSVNSIDVSKLAAGSYVMKITTTNNKTIVRKIAVN